VTALALWIPFRATIGRSDVLQMALLFAVIASPVLWCVGREWRRERGGKREAPVAFDAHEAAKNGERNTWAYPVLIACIGDDRAPSASELRRIARRIKHEAYPDIRLTPALSRRISCAALTALGRPV